MYNKRLINLLFSAGKKPGVVSVIVTTEGGDFLGDTLFTYVDPQEKEKENWKLFMSDRNKMGLFLKMYGKMLRKQEEKKDTKTIRLSGELNFLTVQF